MTSTQMGEGAGGIKIYPKFADKLHKFCGQRGGYQKIKNVLWMSYMEAPNSFNPHLGVRLSDLVLVRLLT